MAKSKRRRERRRQSATKAARAHESFQPAAYRVPEGMRQFYVKKSCTKRISLVEYEVGKGNESASEGMWYYQLIYYAHTRIGADRKTYTCPAKMRGIKCPICEHRNRLVDEESRDKDLIKALKQKKRVLFQLFDHDDPDSGLQLWETSWWFGFGEKLHNKLKLDTDERYEFFSRDDEEGFCIEIDFIEGSWEGKPNWKPESISFHARGKALPEEVVESAVCLEDLLIIEPYEKLKAIFWQTGEDTSNGKESEREVETEAEKESHAQIKTADAKESPARIDDTVAKNEPGDRIDDYTCPACKGSRKSSRGRKCIPCGGSGRIEPAEDDDPDVVAEEEKEITETVPATEDDDDDFNWDD